MTDTSFAPDDGATAETVASVAPEATAPAAPAVEPQLPNAASEPSVATHAPHKPRSIELLQGVEMSVTVELGRTRLLMRDLLSLRAGSVVELDRAAGSPVDVLVNGTLLARGEVVVVDDELGVRITAIAGGGIDEEL